MQTQNDSVIGNVNNMSTATAISSYRFNNNFSVGGFISDSKKMRDKVPENQKCAILEQIKKNVKTSSIVAPFFPTSQNSHCIKPRKKAADATAVVHRRGFGGISVTTGGLRLISNSSLV